MLHADFDLAAALARWHRHLATERRLAGKTLEAYERDVRQFLAFMSERAGEPLSLPAIDRLKPADLRAYMADRRMDGIGSRTLMRNLAGVRSAFASSSARDWRRRRPCPPFAARAWPRACPSR